MGIWVTPEALPKQLELTDRDNSLEVPHHRAVMKNLIPLCVGGGIRHSRTYLGPHEKGPWGRGGRERMAQGSKGDVSREGDPRRGFGEGYVQARPRRCWRRGEGPDQGQKSRLFSLGQAPKESLIGPPAGP